jgi:hypothetical protein
MDEDEIITSKNDNFYCITAFIYREIHPITRYAVLSNR